MKTQKDTFLYAQRQRAERVYGLVGAGDYADLDDIDTDVLLALNYHSKPDGTNMYPSVETLALMTNLSRSSVRRSLSRLVKCELLVVESHQRQHAPVVYRFGTALLDKSDKTLGAHLGAKQLFRQLRSATRTRQSVQPAPRKSAQSVQPATQDAQADPSACSGSASGCSGSTAGVFPQTHRTNNEPIEEQTIEPTPEPTLHVDVDAVETCSLRSHVSRAPAALAHQRGGHFV